MQLVSFTPDVPPGKQVYSTSSDYDTDGLKSLELTSDKFQCLLTVVPPTYTTVYIRLFAHFTSTYWKSCTFLRSYWKQEVLHWAWGITIGQEELQLLLYISELTKLIRRCIALSWLHIHSQGSKSDILLLFLPAETNKQNHSHKFRRMCCKIIWKKTNTNFYCCWSAQDQSSQFFFQLFL